MDIESRPGLTTAPQELTPPSFEPHVRLGGCESWDRLPGEQAAYRQRRQGPLRKAAAWLVVDQPGWLTSLLVHAFILLVLAMVFTHQARIPAALTLSFAEDEEALDFAELQLEPAGGHREPMAIDLAEQAAVVDVVTIPDVTMPTVSGLSLQPATMDADLVNLVAGSVSGLTGRMGRRGSAQGRGATPGSEAAVDRALVWLAAHQQRNGRWSFSLQDCNCGHCRNAGASAIANNAATGLALLPYLGAGQTHENGYHRATVRSGLKYLLDHQGKDGSFYEPHGRLYSHGIATLAICEALAMTSTDPGSSPSAKYRRQPNLTRAVQRAIDFIVRSQHTGGGWRYEPKQRGDTSVVGWQMMALQSAKMAGITVRQSTLDKAADFLNSVQSDTYGGLYGYTSPGAQPGTSAIGVLTRMYLGWDRTHPGIGAGVQRLSETGPSANNVYYNYYATQVMHHYQGPLWESWHPNLRDHLVETQSRRGTEDGSWFFDGDYGSTVGGRLYITAMATMVLEVYYRHMPVYSENAVAQSVRIGD